MPIWEAHCMLVPRFFTGVSHIGGGANMTDLSYSYFILAEIITIKHIVSIISLIKLAPYGPRAQTSSTPRNWPRAASEDTPFSECLILSAMMRHNLCEVSPARDAHLDDAHPGYWG